MLAIIVFGVMMALVIAMFVHSIVWPPERAPAAPSSSWGSPFKKRWSRGVHGAYPTNIPPIPPAFVPSPFAPPPILFAPPPTAAPVPSPPPTRLDPRPDPSLAPDLTLPPRVLRDTLSSERVEHDLLVSLRDAPGDVHARMVYADWLEQRGRLVLASFVREVNLPYDDIRRVITESDVSWRAITCRARFECATYACPRRWDALAPVADDERVRICRVCERAVRYCETMDDVRASTARDESAVLDVRGALPSSERARMVSRTDSRRGLPWDVS
ncbi:MAG: TIGR02996 domain-containing protein [Kofleriaceae bacterium]